MLVNVYNVDCVIIKMHKTSLFFSFYSIVLFMKLLFHPTLSSMVIELGEEYGVLESPGFPQHYRDHEDITWNISAPTGYQIEIRFPVFDLEDSFDEDLGGACPYDYLQVVNFSTYLFAVMPKISISVFTSHNS